ncbi:hypothetical protein KA005_78770, partial [bacterium]|nr:hypothetical protein [bacterium]
MHYTKKLRRSPKRGGIKRGGRIADLFITSYGATDAFFHNEQKNAIDTIADLYHRLLIEVDQSIFNKPNC